MNYKIPLDEIIDYEGNIYKASALAIKEAVRLAKENPEEYANEYGNSKISAVAISKALSGDIKYTENTDNRNK